jgi:hypothetical protein
LSSTVVAAVVNARSGPALDRETASSKHRHQGVSTKDQALRPRVRDAEPDERDNGPDHTETEKQQRAWTAREAPAEHPASMSRAWVGAVLATLICFFPLGIVACVYASQVNGKWSAGDRIGAVTASKQARLFANLALGASVLFVGSVIAVAALGSNASSKMTPVGGARTSTNAYAACISDPSTTYAECQAYR